MQNSTWNIMILKCWVIIHIHIQNFKYQKFPSKFLMPVCILKVGWHFFLHLLSNFLCLRIFSFCLYYVVKYAFHFLVYWSCANLVSDFLNVLLCSLLIYIVFCPYDLKDWIITESKSFQWGQILNLIFVENPFSNSVVF